ncbi:MAG: aldose 1-epimerase [Bryobacteraceae bacterium]|nr:aldose 1-epimerase [Bryobacteraceae bacterium]
MTQAADYSAQRLTVDGVEVIRLANAATETQVLIAPSFGNNSYEMTVRGKRVFWTPVKTLGELQARPTFAGNPFLAPWANRLDQDAFHANGRKYVLNPELRNFRRDPNGKPIHGLLAYAKEWQVMRLTANEEGAEVTSRLEFERYPGYAAQFPFAHTIEMTYRLKGTTLEVATMIENRSAEPMPVAIGYHPYFQVNDAPRDEWSVHVAAREQVVLSNLLIPTGERKPVEFPEWNQLAGRQFDDVFTALVRDERGLATFKLRGKSEEVHVVYGPKYPVAVVYAPPGRGFVCFEPMTAPTNALNLAQAGLYKDLQSIAPGGRWTESFWISARNF